MANLWIYPNPKYPGKIERALSVDLDARTPLNDLEIETLSRALHKMIADREELNEHIREVSQRLTLSAEEKLKGEDDGS